MTHATRIGLGFILCCFAQGSWAFGLMSEVTPAFDSRAHNCFSQAMVGMDSVINSRLGVPPEHALDLTLQTSSNAHVEPLFDQPLLKVILTAYLWDGSPHGYAIKVFYDCASK